MRDVTLARFDHQLSSTIINFELVQILMELMRVFATGGNIHSTLINFQQLLFSFNWLAWELPKISLACQSSREPYSSFFQGFSLYEEVGVPSDAHGTSGYETPGQIEGTKNPKCRRKILVMLSLIRTDSKAEIQPMITAIRNYKGEIKILLCQHMREESRTKTSKWEELTRLRGVGSISKCEAEDYNYTPPTKTGLRSCTWICTWREMAIKIKFVLFGRTFTIIDEDSSQFFLSLIFLWVFEAYLVFFSLILFINIC